MSIAVWKTKKVKLVDVKEMPNNPRSITDDALEGLTQSISRFGYVEPIVLNERTGHIVGGHQRYFVLARAGIKEATMLVVDLSAEEELAANLTLNNPEIEGSWGENAVDLLYQAEMSNSELFGSLKMDALRESLEKTPREKNPPENYDTQCPCCGHKWNIATEDVSVST
jgi:hypothetical protein